jgi:hypothetical protein
MWLGCVFSLFKMEFCVVKAIFRPLFRNMFVIFLIIVLWYVNVIHFLYCCSIVCGVCVCCVYYSCIELIYYGHRVSIGLRYMRDIGPFLLFLLLI